MIKKKLISLLTMVCILGAFVGCSSNKAETTRSSSAESSTSESTEVCDSQENKVLQINEMSESEKIEIGRYLFDEYINENTTDWQMVKDQNLDREPVTCLTDYRIGDVTFVKDEGDKFTVDISYDIQYTDESNFWIAGNGELADDNWVINKCTFADIQKVEDKYLLVNLYTG